MSLTGTGISIFNVLERVGYVNRRIFNCTMVT